MKTSVKRHNGLQFSKHFVRKLLTKTMFLARKCQSSTTLVSIGRVKPAVYNQCDTNESVTMNYRLCQKVPSDVVDLRTNEKRAFQ